MVETRSRSRPTSPLSSRVSSRSRPSMAPMSSRIRASIVPMSSRSRVSIVPMSSRSRPSMAPMSSRIRASTVPMSSRSRVSIVPMSSRSRASTALMSLRTWLRPVKISVPRATPTASTAPSTVRSSGDHPAPRPPLPFMLDIMAPVRARAGLADFGAAHRAFHGSRTCAGRARRRRRSRAETDTTPPVGCIEPAEAEVAAGLRTARRQGRAGAVS